MRRLPLVIAAAVVSGPWGHAALAQSAGAAQAPPSSASAQAPGAQTPARPSGTLRVDANLGSQYRLITRNLRAAAEAMPEADYDFRPVADVRTFGESVAHVAASYYGYCRNLVGTPPPAEPAAVVRTTGKTELVAALDAAVAFCDGYVASLSPSTFLQTYTATSRGPDGTTGALEVERGGLLGNLIGHSNEMYGYLAMYLRLKGIVPPTSRPRTAR